MIQGTILKNGTLKLVISGSDNFDEEVLKQLDGATVRFVAATDNMRLLERTLTGALILEPKQKDIKDDGTKEESRS